MEFVADLHIHSHLSRACSRQLKPGIIYQWCQLKGITAVASGDFTHAKWLGELRENLEPAEPGLFKIKAGIAARMDKEVPEKCRAPVRFLLGTEISSIYKKNGRVRKVHNLVYAPSFEAVKRLNARLEKIGNLHSDGRPILGLDSKDLLSIILEISDRAYLVPAHAWTPHFSVFGSESGFDSLEECFEDLTPHIFAIETGLSSDPPMNWRLSALDKITLISNSDAHSPGKLAREANIFDAELSYDSIFSAIRKCGPSKLLKTLEFFPEEGKYHADGHRKCKARLLPKETMKRKGLCPECGRPVTVGVLHRVEKLADRSGGKKPEGAAAYENLIPLKEVLGEILRVGAAGVRVDREYKRLLISFGSELYILRSLPVEQMRAAGLDLLAPAIRKIREGKVSITPGYDGEFGKISLLEESVSPAKKKPAKDR
ncbi:MAG: endonuclease Q family protein [bacterium]